MNYDIYLVGVGGQGVLAMSDILAEAALRKAIPVNVFPIKGMAQRGGFIKAQVRLGRKVTGPNIPEKGADLVVGMELSESLKAIRFIKPGKDFVLLGHLWLPTAVMLDKAPYPELDQVQEEVKAAGAHLLYLDPEEIPLHEGAPVPANIFVLGALLGHTKLGQIFDPHEVSNIIRQRWKTGAKRNATAFQAGLEVSG